MYIKGIDFKLSNRGLADFRLVDSNLIHGSNTNNGKPTPILDLIPGKNNTLVNGIDWDGKIVSEGEISTYGLTAVDNGAVTYIDETTLSSTTLTIPDNLILKPINGYHPEHDLDYSLRINENGDIEFNGGFFQGFYKLEGYDYQTLPNRYKKGWTFQTRLKPNFKLDDRGLNHIGEDTYGFFLYLGTRAENKFWNTFEGNELSEDMMSETEYDGVTESGFTIPLNPPRIVVKEEKNQFLIYGRSDGNSLCGNDEGFGFGTNTADDIESGESLVYKSLIPLKNIDPVNPFLKYGRSSGKTYCGGTKDNNYGEAEADDDASRFDLSETLDYTKDIIDNAIGFRIRRDGKFQYRRIVSPDCDSSDSYQIHEETTDNVLFEDDVWVDVTLKWVADTELECEDNKARNGTLYLYVDGYLKHVFNNFEEIINKPLYEHKGKQVGVPFNISIGGGTQGLLESMTFGGPDPEDQNLPLQKHFGGSFIGTMNGFKIYEEPLNWCAIKNTLK